MIGKHVLVGVDGSPPSLAAVDLALYESTLRGLPVRVVCVDPWAHHAAWVDLPGAGGVPAQPEQAFRTALDRATSTTDAVRVSGDVLAGDPGAVLVRESASAELIVVGHRGHGGFPELLLGSVAIKLAGHATCPVIVTRGSTAPGADVLVGVSESPSADAAVGFAFHEAALRGTGLLAVHASTGPELTGPTDLLIVDPADENTERHRLLDHALAAWREKYPAVPVRPELRWQRTAGALVDAGRTASLIVIGARGRGGLPGRRLGSVTHAVLHHAACPVAVVH